ncbi:Rz1-like lysis system protein LysC [Halorhodospira halophila]|uniref:Rz1-like lysis system protein LysC n=1 Tax=Halorhodospira halophila TaxID=1053 RepID=UPI001F5D0163|nr:Rz1-like lysis system protein LysC [Halorhodospira halophila]
MTTRLRNGLIVSCLSVSAASCTGTPDPVTVTRTEVVTPPAQWMTCPAVQPAPMDTNRDLLDYTLRLETALATCRVQMAAIREWTTDEAGE